MGRIYAPGSALHVPAFQARGGGRGGAAAFQRLSFRRVRFIYHSSGHGEGPADDDGMRCRVTAVTHRRPRLSR